MKGDEPPQIQVTYDNGTNISGLAMTRPSLLSAACSLSLCVIVVKMKNYTEDNLHTSE